MGSKLDQDIRRARDLAMVELELEGYDEHIMVTLAALLVTSYSRSQSMSLDQVIELVRAACSALDDEA